MRIEEAHLMTANEVMGRIVDAYKNGKKLSIVRLGDGEALTLAQEIVLPIEEVKKREFLSYAGLQVPDLKARNEVVEAIKRADIVGVALNDTPDFTPLLNKSFEAHQIKLDELSLTNACINYFILEGDRLKNFLLQNPKIRVLLIGNATPFLLPIFKELKITVAGMICPVKGLKDWRRVAKMTRRYRFDIALVSAGIAAVPLCPEIAETTGKIAIDFGHAANVIGIRKNL